MPEKYIEPRYGLLFNTKAVGVRFLQMPDNIYFDLDIDVCKTFNFDFSYLFNSNSVLKLKDVSGVLISNDEKERKIKVRDCSGNKKIITAVAKELTRYTALKTDLEEAFRTICNHNGYGATVYVKRFRYGDEPMQYEKQFWSVSVKDGWSVYAQIEVTDKFKKFSWNNDHDYCERHYDTHGIITDCPKFDDWNNYSQDVLAKIAKRYGMGLSSKIETHKFDMYITLTVSTFV